MVRLRLPSLVLACSFALSASGCASAGTNDEVAAAATEDDELVAEITTEPTHEPVVGGPAKGSCSDSAGSLVYTTWHKEGGAPPPPGLVIGRSTLVQGGTIVGQTTVREGGVDAEPDDNHPWTVRLRFLASTKRVLESSGDSMSGSQTYVQKVRVAVDGAKPYRTYVLCTDRWNRLVP